MTLSNNSVEEILLDVAELRNYTLHCTALLYCALNMVVDGKLHEASTYEDDGLDLGVVRDFLVLPSSLYLDALPSFDLLELRDGQSEHAVLVFGLDLADVDRTREPLWRELG